MFTILNDILALHEILNPNILNLLMVFRKLSQISSGHLKLLEASKNVSGLILEYFDIRIVQLKLLRSQLLGFPLNC